MIDYKQGRSLDKVEDYEFNPAWETLPKNCL